MSAVSTPTPSPVQPPTAAPHRRSVLALSCLFPNRAQPNYGVFVLNRLHAVARYCDVSVIAPIPVYPLFDQRLRGGAHHAPAPQREQLAGIDVEHPRFVVLPRICKWIDAATYWAATGRALRRRARQAALQVDVVDVHWTYPDIVTGYLVARRTGAPMVVTVRGHQALYPGEHTLRRWILCRLLLRADAVVTLSDELRERVLALGVAPERVRTILNGVDRAHFRRLPMDECRRELGLPLDRRIVISVGALIPTKGHERVVGAMVDVARHHEADLYVIGGPGPGGDTSGALRARAQELGLKNVHLVNRIPHAQLAAWYSAADVFCLATHGEGCPNVVLEALACGLPVVVTDVGAVREFVVDGVTGFVVTDAKRAEFGAILVEALDRAWDREAIARSMDQWDWDRCARQVVETYETVLWRKGTR